MAISVWEQSTYYAPKDVVIIGCGFVGLWTAYELIHKNPQLKITIIERGVIPSGASTRNAGFSCFGSVSELIYEMQDFKEVKASVQSHEKTISLLNYRLGVMEGERQIRSHISKEFEKPEETEPVTISNDKKRDS